jgi:hypothetical protein
MVKGCSSSGKQFGSSSRENCVAAYNHITEVLLGIVKTIKSIHSPKKKKKKKGKQKSKAALFLTIKSSNNQMSISW